MTKLDALRLAIERLVDDKSVAVDTKVDALTHLIPELKDTKKAKGTVKPKATVPTTATVPAPAADTAQAPAPAANTAQAPAPAPMPEQAPEPVSAQVPVSAEVPVSSVPHFDKAQVASAGAALIQSDPGKKAQLLELLKQYNAPSVADLPEEHLGAFAVALRGLGASI